MADDLTGCAQPRILTVRSSAGSGKTYRLAEHYLKVLLTSALYDSTLQTRMANIVAITFTNKAAQEMRARIIDWMKRIILDIPFENSTVKPLDAIMRGITNVPAGTISPDGRDPAAETAQKVRSYLIGAMDRRFTELLNEFGHFNVGTIDSFANLTLKASAMQLNLPPDFEVTTETRELIDRALQECLRKTAEDASVRTVFDKFIQSYVELEGDQTEWIPKRSLASTITTLWNEEASQNDEFLIPSDSAYRAHLSLRAAIARTAGDLIHSFARQSDFRPVVNVVKAIEKCASEPLARSAYFERSLENCVVKTSIPPGPGDTMLWNSLVSLRRSYAETLSLSKCLPYLDVFGLFKQIFATEVLSRGRVIPIEELNRLLQKIMNRKGLIPEIYYTLCEQYLHFLIDEFQDTSLMQWKNIEVLADEALSRGGSLFLVGDKKQAIYRWRGGRADLVDDVALRYDPIYGVEGLDLDTNYRSGEYIVAFNNIVFDEENLADLARNVLRGHSEEEIRKVTGTYHNSAQKFLDVKQGAGYASIEYLAGHEDEEGSLTALTKEETGIVVEERIRFIMRDVLDRGAFMERDIAFLVRTREEARTIVGILLAMGLNVESEYTVSIRNNPLVRETINLLKVIDKPDDDLSFASFITGNIFSRKHGAAPSDMVNWLAARRLSGGHRPPLCRAFMEDHAALYDICFRPFIERSGYLPLYDLTVDIIRHWEIMALFPDDVPYILHLLEVIKDLEQEGINTIRGLTDRIDDAIEGRGASREDDSAWLLSAPETVNAIRVLTIHKAKGLQFPVVVLPFLSLAPLGSLSGPDRQRFFEAGEGGLRMLYLKKDYLEASCELTDLYRSKEREYLADELNNLYVAMTRAKDELYILLTERKAKKNYLRNYLFNIPQFERHMCGTGVVLGTRRSAGAEKSCHEPAGTVQAFNDLVGTTRWSIRLNAGEPKAHSVMARKKGDAVHRALSLVHALPADSAFIASIARTAASLEHIPEKAGDVIASLEQFFGNPAFSRFFEALPETTVYNEKEIVDGAGNTFKIDRLVIRPNTVDVIDYKTGLSRSEEHKKQLDRYGRLISDLYPGREIRKYILYIDEGEVVEA